MSGSLSGWCLDHHCLPSATSRGCPGTFVTAPPCSCPCHKGKVSDRAREVARYDNRRAAEREAVKRASLAAVQAAESALVPPVEGDG